MFLLRQLSLPIASTMNYAAIILSANLLFLTAADFPKFPSEEFEESVQYADDNGVMKTLEDTNGAQAEVFFRVNKKTARPVALKRFNAGEENRERAIREVKILQILRERDVKNVVQFVAAYENDEKQIILVTEYAGKTDVRGYLASGGRFSAEEIRRIAVILFRAIIALNAAGVIHTDLKPSNLVLTDNREVVVIDFGLACLVTPDGPTDEFNGTSHYLAPEVLNVVIQNFVSECFSLGTIIWALFAGDYRGPFYHHCSDSCCSNDYERANECLENERNWCMDPYFPADMPLGAQDLALHLLEYNVADRYKPQQALDHPWITGADVAV